MAPSAGFCVSYKLDLLNGVHQPGDSYYIALYTSAATISPSTTAYTSSGAVSGTGYVAGGQALAGISIAISGSAAYLTWTSPVWPSSTLSGVTAALIYNATRSNKALAVLTFTPVSSTDNALTVTLPAAGASSTIVLN